MNWQTIVGLIIIVSLVLVIIIKSIIDKKKGKSSCSCGGNCGACNMCHPEASKELHHYENCKCDCKNNGKE